MTKLSNAELQIIDRLCVETAAMFPKEAGSIAACRRLVSLGLVEEPAATGGFVLTEKGRRTFNG